MISALPDWDAKTWAILALSFVLLVVILAVEPLRTSIGSWLVWIGLLLGGGAREQTRTKGGGTGSEQPTEPPTKEDYEREPVDPEEHDVQPNQHRPESGELDRDYWGLDDEDVE